MYPVLLNLRRKRLIINDYLITQAAPLVQIFFQGWRKWVGKYFRWVGMVEWFTNYTAIPNREVQEFTGKSL